MSSSSYKVHGGPLSTCTQTVLATLEEVGASYELNLVDALKGDSHTPEYVAKFNPFGQIPALEDGDFILFESRAIARYIATKHGAESLYPSEPRKRALIEQWLSVNQSNNGPIFAAFLEYFVGPVRGLTPSADRIPEFKDKMAPYLTILDAQLSKTPYLAGENYTLADLSFVSMTRAVVNFCPGFEDTFDIYPSLKRWWADVTQREAWKKIAGKA